jgi:hypothetical protein
MSAHLSAFGFSRGALTRCHLSGSYRDSKGKWTSRSRHLKQLDTHEAFHAIMKSRGFYDLDELTDLYRSVLEALTAPIDKADIYTDSPYDN